MKKRQSVLMVARIVLLTSFGLSGFILGTNYGCRFLVILRDQKLSWRRPSSCPDPNSSVDLLAAEDAKITRNQRAHALQKCCSEHAGGAKSNSFTSYKTQTNKFLKTVIVDRKHRFLYCYVPKVASTNMKRLLLAVQGKVEDPNTVGEFNRRGFEFLEEFPAYEREEMIRTYFKFMFVRHPLERLVSAYRHRILGERADVREKISKRIVKMYRKFRNTSEDVEGDDVTFREFVEYLNDQSTYGMDEHWKPLFETCQPCLIRYDFIGSMERLKLDVSALLAKLNASKGLLFPRKQAKYSQSLTKEEALMYYRNVTGRELDRLRQKYENDFKCFLYPRELQIRPLPNQK